MEMRLNILKVLNCTLTLLRLRGVSSAVTLFQKGAVSWFLARSPAPSACGGTAGVEGQWVEGQWVGHAGSCQCRVVPVVVGAAAAVMALLGACILRMRRSLTRASDAMGPAQSPITCPFDNTPMY